MANGRRRAEGHDLVPNNLTDYPTDDHATAIRYGRAAGPPSADLEGPSSLCHEPIYATTPQITAGGHRITVMRSQGVWWALGQCDRNAVGDGTGARHRRDSRLRPVRDTRGVPATRSRAVRVFGPAVGGWDDTGTVTTWNPLSTELFERTPSDAPVTVSVRTLGFALEETLMGYTRRDLEVVLADELELKWLHGETSPDDAAYSKRELIQAYTKGWGLPRLVGLARRVVAELDANSDRLTPLLAEYDRGGGVGTPAKNLIFAANGPKPELVLRDAVNNDIEIVRNGEHCAVFGRLVPADGLRFSHLINWWRERENIPADVSDREVGHALHARLRASLGDNGAELKVFDTYATRYRASLNIPALIPQVYLHYDPQRQHQRRRSGDEGPLARQRMDFLILFSGRHRVVLEVDGRQHYADGDIASPNLYAQMVAEDRRLRLNGYEVYRFGGAELARRGAEAMLSDFFDQLAARMS